MIGGKRDSLAGPRSPLPVLASCPVCLVSGGKPLGDAVSERIPREQAIETVAHTLWRERPERQTWLPAAAFTGLAEVVVDDLLEDFALRDEFLIVVPVAQGPGMSDYTINSPFPPDGALSSQILADQVKAVEEKAYREITEGETRSLRFCPCGYSWEDGDPSDPMRWHVRRVMWFVGLNCLRLR